MIHSPNAGESHFLSSIAGLAEASLCYFRLTETMLEKSIIDAHEVARVVLKTSGIFDFADISPGERAERSLLLILPSEESARTISLYRPSTKQGDPRLWISGLKAVAKPNDLLVVGAAQTELFAFVIGPGQPELHNAVSSYLVDRDLYDRAFESDVQDLASMMAEVAGRGWINSIGAGAPAVGETLEFALGIQRNPFRTPDFRGSIEIKSSRMGGSQLQTLFSQVPAWDPPITGTKDLVEAYGRYNAAKNRREIYCSVSSTRNSLGWQLSIRPEADRIVVVHKSSDVLHYPFGSLSVPLEAKHRATLFVKARRRSSGSSDQFLYEEATLRTRANFANFLSELHSANGGLDIVAHVKEARARDHGYLWRIQRKRIPALFAFERKLL